MSFKIEISTLEKFLNFNSIDIAIVFPGKKILSDDYGAKIDKHEYVIRLNESLTTGFEKYVGSKTSIRVINNKLFYNHDSDQNIVNFFKNCNDKKFLVLSPEKYKININNSLIKKNCSYHFYFSNFIDELLNFFVFRLSTFSINLYYNYFFFKKDLSLGILLVLILNYLNIRPKIYGLDLNEDMRQRSYYYINKKEIVPIGKHHDLNLERKIFKSLKKTN